MNNRMYEHAATQANLALLRARGVAIVEPGRPGRWRPRASGAWAGWPSRRAILETVEQACSATGTPRPIDGLRVLVTAGGTREPIDSVRYVGNRSSGRMGSRSRPRRRGAAPR